MLGNHHHGETKKQPRNHHLGRTDSDGLGDRSEAMSIEPSNEECASFSTVGHVAYCASLGVSGEVSGSDASEADPVRDSLFALFGLRADNHLRVLAGIPEDDFLQAIR